MTNLIICSRGQCPVPSDAGDEDDRAIKVRAASVSLANEKRSYYLILIFQSLMDMDLMNQLFVCRDKFIIVSL